MKIAFALTALASSLLICTGCNTGRDYEAQDLPSSSPLQTKTEVVKPGSPTDGKDQCVSDSSREISVTPSTNTVSFEARASEIGQFRVLYLPIEIRNGSSVSISTLLNHEYHGGIPPLSDLDASVRTADSSNWSSLPGYLAGETGMKNEVQIKPGSTYQTSILLNWAGTGSVIAFPLIKESGEYVIKFKLKYHSGKSKGCSESPEFKLTVTG